MYLPKLLTAAMLSAGIASADFLLYTEPPIPTTAIPSFSDSSAAASWTTSVGLNAILKYNEWTRSGGSAYQSSLTSAQSEIRAFAANPSNANYSIPAEITEPGTTTLSSKPAWYTALPSGAREFKEMQVSAQFSAVRAVISKTTAGGAAGTGTSKGSAARQTPGAGVGSLGMGAMAAVAAGVFL